MNKPLTILILDDDRNFRRILLMRLKSIFPGSKFVEFDNLAGVREYFTKNGRQTINFALLDQHLPDGRSGELLEEGLFNDIPVLAMSSDESPELPAGSVLQGARFFIPKTQTSQSFFPPLLLAILERSEFEKKVKETEKAQEILDSVKTLIRTLQHEINNPLGAVFGAMYLLRSSQGSEEDRAKALSLIDQSSKRIKTVLEKLSEATELEKLSKGSEELYQVPGDPQWDKSK